MCRYGGVCSVETVTNQHAAKADPGVGSAPEGRVSRWPRRLGWLVLGLAAGVVSWVTAGALVYSPEYVVRVLAWGESDIGDYLDGFPSSPLTASQKPYEFASRIDPRVSGVMASALGVDDLETFLDDSGTQAFLVIKDDVVVYEEYFNETSRDSMLTSFSVAKSFDSALIGIAIDEGHINSVKDPVTDYLPELLERDEAFRQITIRDLLLMAAGLDYQELRWWLFNGDDPLTTYYPDQRDLSLTNTRIIDPPGRYFLYNKYHPQLLGMVIERATGMTVTEFTQSRLWDALGMEHDGAWALDGTDSRFEKMEAGLNARAIDYAKLGRLYLHGGDWNGTRVISSDWVSESTALDPRTHTAAYYEQGFGPQIYNNGTGYYAYMWYGLLRQDEPADFAAEGDHGQFIYVSPAHNVIIVRNGTSYGDRPHFSWVSAFYNAVEDI